MTNNTTQKLRGSRAEADLRKPDSKNREKAAGNNMQAKKGKLGESQPSLLLGDAPKKARSVKTTAPGLVIKTTSAKDMEVLEHEAEDIVSGMQLIKDIRKKAVDLDLKDSELADLFDLHPSYWNSLRNGYRSIAGISRKKLELMADFMGLSMIEVYARAGVIKPGDFMIPGVTVSQFDPVLAKMRSDPYWQRYAPAEAAWKVLPDDVKLLICLLYERQFSEELITKNALEVDSQG